ncbi:MAG: hypothetical protein ACRD27_09290, partial [Terracidiphilus sp.]
MKLTVPRYGGLDDLDRRVICLAEWMGMGCEQVALEPASDPAEYLARRASAECTALAVHGRVLERWLGSGAAAERLAGLAGSRFRHLFAYGLRANEFDGQLVAALSRGQVTAVERVPAGETEYSVDAGAGPVCGAFAGLRFGAVDWENDRVLRTAGNGSGLQALISIGGRPLMATVTTGGAELIVVAGEQAADIDQKLDCAFLPQYFSRFMPHAMALRRMAGESGWRPAGAYAALMIDDPA